LPRRSRTPKSVGLCPWCGLRPYEFKELSSDQGRSPRTIGPDAGGAKPPPHIRGRSPIALHLKEAWLSRQSEGAAIVDFHSFKLVSWDVDGTLYSIRRMKWRLLAAFLREAAGGAGSAAHRDLLTLKNYRKKIDAARLTGGLLDLDEGESDARKTLFSLERRWYGPAIKGAGPRNGVEQVLSFLAARSIPQVVISDYESNYKLAALRLEDYFASSYVGERWGFVKPSPVLFQRAAADYDIQPVDLLHIGDRVDRDEKAARAAGCQCLILGRDFANFDELLEQLETRQI
jgi:HAD superfamily hydrolase (TIGR01549 family)